MSLLLNSIFTYIRTPRQPVSDSTGAAPVTPPSGPEIPTEQTLGGETGPKVGVTLHVYQVRFNREQSLQGYDENLFIYATFRLINRLMIY